ncbi:hypothetical protein FO519_005119 [Halicephalobus sp. NKZ332]|nr:hypothetical protein FO519_005119 [Halicephalobus sp. NKZ332]
MKIILIFLILIVAATGKKYCGQQYDRMVAMTCKFGKESTPCLAVANECCSKGCDLQKIQEACCFTDSCLASCYPGKNYKMGQVY